MTGINKLALYGSLIGIGAVSGIALCIYLIYRRLANGNRWKRTPTPPATRIKISGNPLDSETNIKLVHQQPRFSRSGTMAAELSPLVRHNTLRDFGRVERMRCNTLTGQQHLIATTMDSNRRSLVRPLSQPAQYLARSTSTPTVVSNSLSTDSVLGESQHGSHSDTNKEPPQVELTLVYVSPSAQLLVHIHRLSNVPTSRYGKESVTYVKMVLDGRIRRSYRSAVASKAQQPPRCGQVFKFSDVTIKDLLDSYLMTSVYLGRGRWRSTKKLGSWRLHLADIPLADGVPRSCTGILHGTDGHKDAQKQVEPYQQMTSAAKLGQLLLSLQHVMDIAAVGQSRLKILIRRAQGLTSTKSLFEPEYIVVVNASYPDGTSETKETFSARGKVPVWNQTIEFDVTNQPIGSCWLHLVLLRKSKKDHGPHTTVGHLTLGANSTPDGEKHWKTIVNPHDDEITQWHCLTSR